MKMTATNTNMTRNTRTERASSKNASLKTRQILSTGRRLFNERKRLKLSQVAMARMGGVTETTYINYEHGLTSPRKSFLEEVSEKGVDIAYVVMGKDEEIIMTPLAKRLIEERHRLKLKPENIAQVGVVSLSLYQRYEASNADFDAVFLESISQIGFDIHYILTGERSHDS